MRKSLRIPAALAFVVSGSAGIVACGDDAPAPTDAAVSCIQYCVPTGTDATNCPNFSVCVSPTGTCPAGCMPEPII